MFDTLLDRKCNLVFFKWILNQLINLPIIPNHVKLCFINKLGKVGGGSG